MYPRPAPQPWKRFEPRQKNGNLYYIRLNTPAGRLYKIGFTSKDTVHERLAYNGNGDEKMLEKVIFFVYLDDAFEVECELHELLADKVAYSRDYSHEVAPLHRNGQTELYRSDVLGLDTDFTSDEAYYRRQGLSEQDVQRALKRQKMYGYALLPIIWLPIKIFAGALWAYEKFSQADPFEKARKRKTRLEQLLKKIQAAQGQAAGHLQQERPALLNQATVATPPNRGRPRTARGGAAETETLSTDGRRLASALKRARFGEAASYVSRSQPLDMELIQEFETIWDWQSLSASNSVCWSPILIQAFEDRWNWTQLSRNEALPWSEDLIADFSERWDWRALSNNAALPWTASLVSRHEAQWDWGSLSENTKIPFDEELMERFADQWDWDALSGNNALPFTPELVERFCDRWDWVFLSQNSALPKSLELIEQFKDHWDWAYLTDCDDVRWSPELIHRFEDRLYWPWLSGRTDLPWSTALLERFADRWDWQRLAANQGLPWSTALVDLFEDRWVIEADDIGIGGLAGNESAPWSLDLIQRFEHRLDWRGLSKNASLPWSMDLITQYEDHWDWSKLSRNKALPWSVDLIARFQDRWDWGGHEPGLSCNDGVPWTPDLISRFRGDFDATWLSANTRLPWSTDLIDQFKDELSWSFLSRNEGIPWSMDLIERYAERWDWGAPGLHGNRAVKLPSLTRDELIDVLRASRHQKQESDDRLESLTRTLRSQSDSLRK